MANEDVIRKLAELSYSHHLLVRVLQEKGILQPEEPMNRETDEDFEQFLKDFREH